MGKEAYLVRLNNFSVLRNRFDRFLFENGLTLLLLQLFITTLIFLVGSKNPFGPRYTLRWVEVVFFIFVLLVFMIELFVVRDFFENIPRTFRELTTRNVIKGLNKIPSMDQKFVSFIDEFEGKLNNRVPLFLGGLLEALILIGNQRSMLFPIIFVPEGYPVSALFINFFTLFVPMSLTGYVVSVVSWKCFVTGYYVHRFSSIFSLTVSPSHPDKAGGLKPIGDLIFSMALILIVASLALSIIVVAGPVNETLYRILVEAFSKSYSVIAPHDLLTTVSVAKVSLVIVLFLSVASFLFPLISTHNRMHNEKRELLSSLTGIGNRIADLEKQSKKLSLDYKIRNDIFEEISSLSKVYERASKVPVWPFDRDVLLKFFTPQVVSLLSLLGVIQPILDAISSVMK